MDEDYEKMRNTDKVLKLEEEISKNIDELTSANRRLRRKIFDLYTIFEISRHLNSVLDTDSLLDGIILTIIGQMGVSGCAIFTAHKDEKALVLAKSRGLKLRENKKYHIPFNSRLFQTTEETPNIAYNMDELESKFPESKKEIDLLKSIDCALVIPMTLKNKICGLLVVTERIARTPFMEDDKDFLAILANQLSVAVENARLFQSEKEAYNQLSKAQRQLVETEKLAALGQLSARVAHEVNNPLGIIKNYIEIISQNAGDSGKLDKYVGILSEEVNRIAAIVRQLLDFYHPRSIEKKEVNLSNVIDELIVLVSVQMEANKIELKKNYPPEMPRVWASSEQLKQVFLNLIMNSRDFMPDGGEIIISGREKNGSIVLDFADSGIGIEETELSKVFDPFYTTKTNGAGTGLGLSVCYGIIQNHGGNISVKNRPEGGAQFTVNLPVYNAS
ncbi:MAG: GAF domain-containing protein [candidate division Zixibacteria bacterium]|nr:GAF domain-containing protein [candidate division Zixibacteria bacterium]NIR67058.1 GAF domain-containing protein [candidate division Zixibacteria bacterium]NIS15646.1 GAF domain-containing protein [candidate division Zixibacteria bacterium]NIS48469.1 GAF domain-containing protein [candidate division Zixibacteria bacterium]NIT52154.1 GAF domain-containing protein [candidate division Zixibacteria bacterium]